MQKGNLNMLDSIKGYFEYRKNKKIVKRELAKIGATALQTIPQTVEQSTDIVNFIVRFAKEVENLGTDEFIKTVQEEVVSYIVENIHDKDNE